MHNKLANIATDHTNDVRPQIAVPFGGKPLVESVGSAFHSKTHFMTRFGLY